MTLDDLRPVTPLLIIALTSIVVMLASAFFRRTNASFQLTLIGLFIAFGSLFTAPDGEVTNLLVLDGFARYFLGLELLATFAVCLLVRSYANAAPRAAPEPAPPSHELYLLILIALLGCSVLVMSRHFASFFLGLEILSVGLYAMIGYYRNQHHAPEAAIKYLVLAGASSAFLLFGMAIIYLFFGTMQFELLAERLAGTTPLAETGVHPAILIVGSTLLFVGVGFKLAVVPFHMWTPDVYQGAPAPVTAFIATVSKAAVFAVLLRYASWAGLQDSSPMTTALSAIAIASMFVGNWLALTQENLKRLLAYSSISHLGYMLVAFIAGGTLGGEAVMFYLAAYVVTILAAFGVITLFSNPQHELEQVSDYRGLYWRHPWLAAIMTLALLSLAGIPLTMGFIGKFYVFTAGVDSEHFALTIILAINSAISVYYYLRVVARMLATTEKPEVQQPGFVATIGGSAAVSVLGLLLIVVGAYPGPLVGLVQSAVLNIIR